MTDDIRDYINDKYFIPAKNKGLKEIIIRAGTIHDEMRFENRVPSVCNALRSQNLQERYNVQLTNVKYGPNVNQENAKNIWYTFTIA
ncbi:hypothetical protein HNV12_22855 [Methanococcoides sp. SA1]|nr:hypothetical protein [Methanococcoides sp. SA1]